LGSSMARTRKRRKAAELKRGYFQNEMTEIARRVRKLIKYIGLILFAIFTYLQLKDFQIGTVIENISPDLLRRLTLIAYYWCWIFGTTFDTDIQEVAYFSEKGRFKLTERAIGLLLLFGFVAAVLLWAANDDRLFAGTLTVFFLFNVGGFAYILWFVKPIILASKDKYLEGKNHFSLAQLELVSGYMNGSWQWKRFGLGVALIAIMNAICFSDSIKIAIAEGLARFIPITADLLSERLPTFTFVTFVALMEGWIWVQRAKVSVALDLLEQLSTKFTLEPIRLAIEK
jgi:hypothetical protein